MTMTFAQEAGFIVAAYAVTVFVVAALIAWVVLDYSAQRRLLGELEEQGVTRRSRKGLDS
jgi:heme exporter protein D